MQPKSSIKEISWHTEEPGDHFRSVDWFWTVGAISFTVAVGALLVHNWLFAILSLLAGGTIISNALKTPHPTDCTVNTRGIVVNQQFFPYNNLTSFWIDDEAHPTLIVTVKGALIPRLWIPIAPEINLPRLQELLESQIPEKRHEKTFAEILGERLGI